MCTAAQGRGRLAKATRTRLRRHQLLGSLMLCLCSETCRASFIRQSILKTSRIVEPTSIGGHLLLPADQNGTLLRHLTWTSGARFQATKQASADESPPHPEPSVCRDVHTVRLDLPLGIVIEDLDGDTGVSIIGISPEGNASIHNQSVFGKLKSPDVSNFDATSAECVCIRDKVLSINGDNCHESTFDEVASLLSAERSNTVTLRLGRVPGSTVVNYCDGVCISAQPGESYGFLASKCGVNIDYECRTGNCGTCLRQLDFPDKLYDLKEGERHIYQRSILNCVGKVPRSYAWLHVLKP